MNLSGFDLRNYKRIVFFTGAGLSAESGIPTYQGKGGFWSLYDYEEFACQRAFDRDPEKVWDFHEKRRELVSASPISTGHKIIADISENLHETKVVTQNIDGLHQRAGSKNVTELHGSLWRVRCSNENVVTENFDVPLTSRRCPCGAYLRPDIVWFEDPLEEDCLKSAINAVLKCDLLITVGTSASVFPAADIPMLALRRKITSIEINIEPTHISRFYTCTCLGSAGDILQRLWNNPQSLENCLMT
jgi:NAD-dependent deacetylase